MQYVKSSLIATLVLAFVYLFSFIPLPLTPITDFWMLYSTAYTLVRGVGIYDYDGQVSLISQAFPEVLQEITQPYYVYPPWLVYSAFFLGFLEPDQAARLWFWLNIAIISLSVLIVANNHKYKMYLVMIAFGWSSLNGLLFVGQFVTPLILGTALVMTAIRRVQIPLLVAGVFLLTYKPHLGGLIILTIVGWLLLKNTVQHRNALLAIVLFHLGIGLITFLIQPLWLTDYIHLITQFRQLETFNTCEICSSGSIFLTGIITGVPDTTFALYLGIAIIILGGLVWLFSLRPPAVFDIERSLSWSAIVTTLAVPYLNNYDYTILLVPFLWYVQIAQRLLTKTLLATTLLLPWVGVLLQNRAIFAVLLACSSCLMGIALFTERFRSTKEGNMH